jgi:hypothetical protein
MKERKEVNKEPQIRRIMIATPAYSGTVHVLYVDSLLNTMRSAPQGCMVTPVWIPGDALLQRARNSLCAMAIEAEVDDLVFIDSDMAWNPQGFWRLLSHDVDMVGGLIRQKREPVVFTFRPKPGEEPDTRGLLEVNSTGCGFLRITKKALHKLWNASKPYKDGPHNSRALFEVVYEKGEIISEDIAMCHKWKSMRGQVYIDTQVACGHIGEILYRVPTAAETERRN